MLGTLDLRAFSTGAGAQSKRDTERNGILFLLNKLFGGQPVQYGYSPEGKPYLKDRNAHISVSHSHDKLAILVNEKESTGVDIELIRDKVVNVKHKFLCEAEQQFTGNDIEKLTTLWAAKEAIYKAYGLKGVDFKENMFVEAYNEANTDFYGRIEMPGFKKKYILCREKTDNYILVYIAGEV